MNLLQPKAVSIPLQAGGEKAFIISKFPAVAGREIIAKYPLSAVPKLGDYATSEEIMLKLMAFVAVETSPGDFLPLASRALVDNHVPDYEALMRLEWKTLEYNCSFFQNGMNSDFFASIKAKAPAWISQTLTDLLQQSSQADKQPSGS